MNSVDKKQNSRMTPELANIGLLIFFYYFAEPGDFKFDGIKSRNTTK